MYLWRTQREREREREKERESFNYKMWSRTNLYKILLACGCGNLTHLIFYELYRLKPIKEYIQRI